MKPRARFAILVLFPLGCATGENSSPSGDHVGLGVAGTAGDSAGGTAASMAGTGTVAGTAAVIPTTGGGGFAGATTETAGSFSTSGTFSTAGTVATAGTAGAGGTNTNGGTSSGGSAGTAANGGSAGKSTGGAAGTTAGGMPSAGTGGTGTVGAYCDNQTKSPLPYTVNDGFVPSLWQGDYAAISNPAGVQPDACAARSAGAVGACSTWRFTPNAVTPAWAGVGWSRVFDAQYTHPPVCIAAGATKVTFQARGAAGGEEVTFSAAGAAEIPFTLTNAWKQYSIPLAGVTYNTAADGVDSGFFWKVAPPTPAGGAVTFFVDDIQFSK
jgi:hypothetical protein